MGGKDQKVVAADQLRTNHAALSPLWAQLLDFAAARPEFYSATSFGDLAMIEAQAGYAVQPWPTLVDRTQLTELAERNSGLCRLISSLPFRLFGEDFAALLRFYGYSLEMLPLLRFAHKRPQHLDYIVGRSDLLNTPRGFRCLEFNVSAFVGGYQNGYLARHLRVPLFDRFLADTGAEVRCIDVVHRFQVHCVGCVLRHFRRPEVNLALQVDRITEHVIQFHAEFESALQEVLAGLEGVTGSLHLVTPDQLQARGGLLYHGDTRLHMLIEQGVVPTTAVAYRCWMNDSVLLLNGPLTPIWSDKRNLALLSELAESDLFDVRERRLIAELVPWTRRLSELPVAGHESLAPSAAEVVDRQRELVIKRATGSGGTEVFMGSAESAGDWARQVEKAFAQGDWIVQELVESLPYVYQLGADDSAPHEVVWGLMAFGDLYGGDIVRVAPIDQPGVVNASRGARIGVLWEVVDSTSEESPV